MLKLSCFSLFSGENPGHRVYLEGGPKGDFLKGVDAKKVGDWVKDGESTESAKKLAEQVNAQIEEIRSGTNTELVKLYVDVFENVPTQENLTLASSITVDNRYAKKGSLEVLEMNSPLLKAAFKEIPDLKLFAYGNIYKEMKAQGMDANVLPMRSILKLDMGKLTVTYPDGKSATADLFPWDLYESAKEKYKGIVEAEKAKAGEGAKARRAAVEEEEIDLGDDEEEPARVPDESASIEAPTPEAESAEAKKTRLALGLPQVMTQAELEKKTKSVQEFIPKESDRFFGLFPKLTEVERSENYLLPDDSGVSHYIVMYKAPDGTEFNLNVTSEPVDGKPVREYVAAQKALGNDLMENDVRNFISLEHLGREMVYQEFDLAKKIRKKLERLEEKSLDKKDISGEKNQAEYVRLNGELSGHLANNRYKGAYEFYQRILALEKKGVQVAADTHKGGAQATQSPEVGDIGAAREAWRKAAEAAAREGDPDKAAEFNAYIKNIDANHGEIKISVNAAIKGTLVLEPSAPPKDPWQRGAIEFARRELAKNREFSGRLPNGRYSINGKTFDVPADKTVNVQKETVPEAKVQPVIPTAESAPLPENVPASAPHESGLADLPEGYYRRVAPDLLLGDVNGKATIEWPDGLTYTGEIKNSVPYGKGMIDQGGDAEASPVLDFVDGKATWTLADGSKKEIIWDKGENKFEIRDRDEDAEQAPVTKVEKPALVPSTQESAQPSGESASEASPPSPLDFQLKVVATPRGSFHTFDLSKDFSIDQTGSKARFEYEETPRGMMPLRLLHRHFNAEQARTILPIYLGADWESKIPEERKGDIIRKVSALYAYEKTLSVLSEAKATLKTSYPDETYAQEHSVFSNENDILTQWSYALKTELANYLVNRDE